MSKEIEISFDLSETESIQAEYVLEENVLEADFKISFVPNKISELENDVDFVSGATFTKETENLTNLIQENTTLINSNASNLEKEIIERKQSDTENKNEIIGLIDSLDNSKANKIDVYSKTEINQTINNIDNKVQQLENSQSDLQTALDSKANVSDIPDVSKFITKDVNNLSNYLTKTDVNVALSLKVDKKNGYSLLADSEIERLLTLKNYDDTQIKNDISKKADSTVVNNLQQEKADKIDTYTKSEVDAKVSSVYRPKGNVETYADLPVNNLSVGDVYNILDTGANYVWTDENKWDKLSETVDLTPYLTKEEASKTYSTSSNLNTLETNIENKLSDIQNNFYTKNETNTLLEQKQDVLTVGAGLEIKNGVLSNTQTSAEWGNIQGDITLQSDLQSALDDKANNNEVVHLANNETISGAKTFAQPIKIQNGAGTGSLIVGGDVNAGTVTNGTRKLARVAVPTQNNKDLTAILLGFDSNGDDALNVKNNTYDSISFGGQTKITNATSPMSLGFCVTKTRNSTSASDKVYVLEADSNEARFNVQPNYKGVNLATTVDVTNALSGYAKLTDIPDVSSYLENQADFPGSLAIGENNTISRNSVALGLNNEAQGQFSTTLGSNNYSYNDYNICIGEWCDCTGQNSICIGNEAMTADENSIQLGQGFNFVPNSFQVFEHQLLDNNTGLIPDERLSTNIARTVDIPTYTAGDNITIENNVISANVPQSGEVEINVSAPIIYGGIESGADNISTAENGRNYLNDKAFWASIPELLPTTIGEGRNTNSSFGDYTGTNEKVQLFFRKLKGYNGVYPQLNLDGYNVILHNFKVGDIVMGDRTQLKLQICFGKLEADGTFVPRIICRTQENAGASFRFAKISRLYDPSSTKVDLASGPWDGEYVLNYETSSSFYSLSYKKEGKLANIENIRGVKIIEKDNAYSLAWVRESGEVVELSDTGVFADLDFNCVLFSGVTFELPQPNVNYDNSFDASKFYVANGTIDNVIVRMVDGSSAKSISLKYNTDDFIVEDEELKINPDRISTMPIGTIIPVNASANYVPNGCLPCDGAEYSKAQFNDLWENFLTNGTIGETKTYNYWYNTYEYSVFEGYTLSATPNVGDEIYQSIDGEMQVVGYVEEFEDNQIFSTDISTVWGNRQKDGDISIKISDSTTSLLTCSYTEYESDFATYGQCSKFGVDIDNEKFRVPLINKVLTDIADSVGVRGNGTAIGLTNGTNNYAITGSSSTGFVGSTADYGKPYGTGTASGGTAELGRTNAYGLVPDASKSGIIADTTNAKTYSELRYFVFVANGQTNQSMMDWSQWASSLQGKLNADHSNDTKPYIVETSDKSISPSWYRVWSDGFCQQGGEVPKDVSEITFLKEFIDKTYTININYVDYNSTNNLTVVYSSPMKTNSGFSIKASTGGERNWQASGYIV